MDRLVEWCAPWSSLFDHSKVVAGTVTGLHIMALVIGGGLAIAADRMTLRLAPEHTLARRSQLDEVRSVHGIVLAGISLLFVTGVLLAASDVETFLTSPIFWVKLVLAASLVINGGVLMSTERRLSRRGATANETIDDVAWSRVRFLAWSSVFLWTATAVVGIVLSNAA